MKKVFYVILFLSLAPAILYSEEVSSTVNEKSFGMGINGTIGVGGDVDWILKYKGERKEGWDDLTTSKGLSISFFFPLTDFFAIGIDSKVIFWTSDTGKDNDMDPDTMLDFSPTIKIFHRFDSRLTGYIKILGGFSYNIIGESDLDGFTMKDSLGYNYGLFGGLQMSINKDIDGLIEFGYLVHNVGGNIKGYDENSGIKLSYEFDMGQFFIGAGIAF